MSKDKPNVGELPALVLLKRLYPSSKFIWQGEGDTGAFPDILRYGKSYSGVLEGIEVTTVSTLDRGIMAKVDNVLRQGIPSKESILGVKKQIMSSFERDYTSTLRRGIELVKYGFETDGRESEIEAEVKLRLKESDFTCLQQYEIGFSYGLVEAIAVKLDKWVSRERERTCIDCKYKSIALVITESIDDLNRVKLSASSLDPLSTSIYLMQMLDITKIVWDADGGPLWSVYVIYEAKDVHFNLVSRVIHTIRKNKVLPYRMFSMTNEELLIEVRKEWEKNEVGRVDSKILS